MKLAHRRQFLHLAAGAAALPAVSRTARAQAYPSRPVRIVGGSSSNLVRTPGPPGCNHGTTSQANSSGLKGASCSNSFSVPP
jgi:hypothetical protein